MNLRTAIVIAGVCALFTSTMSVHADTSFSYQGELKDGGVPANGSYDLDFSIWDALGGGSQVGSTINLLGVAVNDGRFTVELDFGADAFDNSARWLQIDVDGTPLSPRQAITRAPYSIQTRGIFVDESNRVGIGTTTPVNALHVESADTWNEAIYAHIGGSGGTAIFGHASATSLFNAGVRGKSNSSAGIGVLGEATASGYGVQGISSGEFARGVYGSASGAQAKGVVGNGGLYGVHGTTSASPGYGVYGEAWGSGVTYGVFGKSQASSGRGLYGHADHSSGTTYGVVGQVDSPSGYAAYFIGPAGSQNYFSRDVGINTLSPNYLLHVNGSAGKPGGGSWSNSSDRRLKKNIRALDGALASLLSVRGVTFEYKDPEAINELAGRQVGVIAQEVEAIFPDWVDERADGYKAVTFRGFEALAIEAMRELRDELATTQAENELLRTRLAELEGIVHQLTLPAPRENER